MSSTRWIAAALVVGAAVLGACGGGGSEDRAIAQVGGACDAIGVAHRDLLAPEHLTFADLLRDDPWTVTERDAVAAVRVLAPTADPGRFGPLLDHLAARHRALVLLPTGRPAAPPLPRAPPRPGS